jgi:hypothetical protein
MRALLVFQERGRLAYTSNEPNRQDLLLEMELATPAPEGARWVIACPPDGANALPGRGGVLDEVAGFWRKESKAEEPAAAAWPAERGAARVTFGKSMKLGALQELLGAAGLAPGEELLTRLNGQSLHNWVFFVAPVPAGARFLGPVQITFQPLAARYPGALGARRERNGPWRLPPLELMVLHSHFINVHDNLYGLDYALGLRKKYQDPGTLKKGRPLWEVPRPKKPGERPGPGSISAEGMPATGEFVASLGAARNLRLTVVEGRPRCSDREGLDFKIYSHYPSAVDPVGNRTAFIALGACLVVTVVLIRFLLRRRGLA